MSTGTKAGVITLVKKLQIIIFLLTSLLTFDSYALDNFDIQFCTDGSLNCNDRITIIQSNGFEQIFSDFLIKQIVKDINKNFNYSVKSLTLDFKLNFQTESNIEDILRKNKKRIIKSKILIIIGDTLPEYINNLINSNKRYTENIEKIIVISTKKQKIDFEKTFYLNIEYTICKLLAFFNFVNFSSDNYYVYSDQGLETQRLKASIVSSLLKNNIPSSSIRDFSILNITMYRKNISEINKFLETSTIISIVFGLKDESTQTIKNGETVQEVLKQHNQNHITVGMSLKYKNTSIIYVPSIKKISKCVIDSINDEIKKTTIISMDIILNPKELKKIGKPGFYTKGIHRADRILTNM